MATEKSIAVETRGAETLHQRRRPAPGPYIFDGHQDEAVQAIIAARPQAKLNPAVLRQQIDTLKDYAMTDATKSLPFGTMAAVRLETGGRGSGRGRACRQKPGFQRDVTNELIDPAIVADVSGGKH